MNRDDDTPPSRPGRYRTPPAGVPVDLVTPLPPPPIVHRPPPTPVPGAYLHDEGCVPRELDRADITGRVQLALAGAPPPKLHPLMPWLLGVAASALVGGVIWWADVREGLRNRPTKDEVQQMIRPLQQDVRAIERLLDQRLPPRQP